MADTISTRDVLAPFQTVSALNELNDYFLLQANRTGGGGDGSQAAVRIPASVIKAYIMAAELAPRIVEQISASVSIAPNVLNHWNTLSSLSITSLIPGTEGYVNEYMLEFTVIGNNFRLTLPSEVVWLEEPDWENGLTYQVSIVNNLAVGAGWEAANI